MNPQDFIDMMHGRQQGGSNFHHNPQEFEKKLTQFVEKFKQELKAQGEDADVDVMPPQIQQMQNSSLQPLVDIVIYNKKTHNETTVVIGYDRQGYTFQYVYNV